jgi:hypothetical protein
MKVAGRSFEEDHQRPKPDDLVAVVEKSSVVFLLLPSMNSLLLMSPNFVFAAADFGE